MAIVFAAMFLVFLKVQPAPQESRADAVSGSKAWPAQWQELDLPVIPDGKMVWSSDASPDNGLEFEMIVQQDVEDIGAFYEEEMEDRDFDFYLPEDSGGDGYSNEFTSDEFEITINVQPHPRKKGSSRIHVGIREREENHVPTSYSSVAIEVD